MLIRPFFQQNQLMDMQLYLSTSSVLPDKLLWSEELVPLAGKNFTELHTVTLTRDDLAPVRHTISCTVQMSASCLCEGHLLSAACLSTFFECRHWTKMSPCT